MIRLGDRTDRLLYMLVGLVMLLGGTAIAVSLAAGIGDLTRGDRLVSWPAFAALALLVAAGDLINVEVRIRAHRHGITWADAAVLIGLAMMPVEWVVLATALGIALSETVRRRQAVKFAFAITKETTTAAIGGLVLLASGAVPPLDAAELVLLGLAFLVIIVVDPLLTVPVVALSTRTSVASRIRANWDIRLLMAAGRLIVVVLAVLALRAQPELLYGLPLLVLLGHLWHERWVRTRQERQAWQNLASVTESFSGVDLDEVVEAAVTGGALLFSADELEVELWLGAERRLVRGSPADVTYDGEPGRAPPDRTNVYAVALHGYPGQRDIGVLRLRFRGQVRMSEREQAMLTSFAASLDTALRNAAAYGQLGQASEVHAHAAAHDSLTGLANRRQLERLLSDALPSQPGAECRIAVLMIDLKHFKEVNDTLGHLTGDQVLVQAAERLSAAGGPGDVVARFGGDEFAVLLRDALRPHEVQVRAERFLAYVRDPMVIDGLPLMIEANAGLSLAVDPDHPPQDGGEPGAPPFGGPSLWAAELMRRADVAMYQAKRTSRSLVFYTPAGDTADRDRLTLAGQLPKAVAEHEFVLHFQPILDLATGQVTGAEALARWRHPTRGQLAPGQFLDLLERSNQLGDFTAAVLEEALTAADGWRASGYDLSVSVNISARSLLDAGLPAMVRRALDAHGTCADRLCLELTETLAISQLDVVDRVLHELHHLGVRLALDDFGTGHSSLAALARVPVHELKIDRSFIRTLRRPWPAGGDEPVDRPDAVRPDGDPPEVPDAEAVAQAKAVVRSTVQLGKALDLTVVAEGIETYAQRQLMWRLGCELGQGHLFARALAGDQLLAHLTAGVDGRPGRLAAPMHEGDNIIHLGAMRRTASRWRGTSAG